MNDLPVTIADIRRAQAAIAGAVGCVNGAVARLED